LAATVLCVLCGRASLSVRSVRSGRSKVVRQGGRNGRPPPAKAFGNFGREFPVLGLDRLSGNSRPPRPPRPPRPARPQSRHFQRRGGGLPTVDPDALCGSWSLALAQMPVGTRRTSWSSAGDFFRSETLVQLVRVVQLVQLAQTRRVRFLLPVSTVAPDKSDNCRRDIFGRKLMSKMSEMSDLSEMSGALEWWSIFPRSAGVPQPGG